MCCDFSADFNKRRRRKKTFKIKIHAPQISIRHHYTVYNAMKKAFTERQFCFH